MKWQNICEHPHVELLMFFGTKTRVKRTYTHYMLRTADTTLFLCMYMFPCLLFKVCFCESTWGSVRGILLELEDLGFPCPRRQQILIQTNVFQPKRRWLCLYVLIAELSYKRLYLSIFFAILITLWCMLALLYPFGCQRFVVPILVYMITWFCTRFEYIHFPKIRLHHLYGSS